MRRRATIALPFLLALGLLPAAGPAANAARGRHVDVFPGRGALQEALDQANAGDVLRIHRGRYVGQMAIDEPITLKGVGNVVIDGKCKTPVVIALESNGVTLRNLTVQGAHEPSGGFSAEVNVSLVGRFTAKNMVVRDTCDAEYGFNVYDSGKVRITGSVGHGFRDTAFYVGDIDRGPVTVKNNESYDNQRGFLVENSPSGSVTIVGNEAHDNRTGDSSTGILFFDSDGHLVQDNVVQNNGVFGIHMNGPSDSNRIFNNVVSGSGGLDGLDDGTGNCWNGTVTGTRQPDPLPTC